MKISKIFISIFCLFLIGRISYANDPVQVKTHAWPLQVTLGDEIKLFIQIERPKGYSIEPLSPQLPLGPFEIKNIEVFSYDESSPIVRQTFLLKLTVFQLGQVTIPPHPIHFTDSAGRSQTLWTEPVLIQVKSVIKDPKAKTDIRPIKGPVSLDLSMIRTAVFGLLAFLLLSGLIIKIVLRRKHQMIMDLESLKPPHERAMLELERLQAKPFLSEGKVKEYYSELADILRRYLDRRFKIETLELTTFEITRDLKMREFNPDLLEKIREFLENSDLVKFAKFIPPRSLADQMVMQLCEIVDRTKPLEEAATKGVAG